MKNITLSPDMIINYIMVVDKKTKQVFQSQNLCMSLKEYIWRSDIKHKNGEFPRLPQIIGKKLGFIMDASNVTSEGYKYKASGYFVETPTMTIFVSVIEGVETKVGSNVYKSYK